jgi:hypothetical protein
MSPAFTQVYDDVRRWAECHGVRVRRGKLGPEKPGEFDGLSVTINPDYGPEERCFYLVHALGSIIAWALDPRGCHALFAELRAAKAHRLLGAARLGRAVERYRAFEIRSSEYAVWILNHLGHAAVVPTYTDFFRADLEALTQFHRTGKAPVWEEFFRRWSADVLRGRRTVEPFVPVPVPPFRPVPIRHQEIMQKEDAGP